MASSLLCSEAVRSGLCSTVTVRVSSVEIVPAGYCMVGNRQYVATVGIRVSVSVLICTA